MSSINEAIFRGRLRREPLSPSEVLKRSQNPLTSQLMARRAIEAVLAGGYTTCESKKKNIPNACAPEASRGIARSAILWISLFALAGLIGIGTSRLPGHAVRARQASRSVAVEPAVVARDKIQKIASLPMTRPVEIAPAITIVTTPVPQIAEPAPAPPAPATQNAAVAAPHHVMLHPVAKLATPSGILDSGSILETASTPDDKAARLPVVEEVVYEGEPVPTAQPAKPARETRTSKSSGRRATPVLPAADAAGAPRVEGIFWDKVRPMALVNGNIVEVGSRVEAYKVLEIKPGLLVLTDGADRLELRP